MTGDAAFQAYRKLMFELAGEGGPSERLEQGPAELRALVTAARDRLRVRPAEGEWSVIELVGHIVDAEVVLGYRLRGQADHCRGVRGVTRRIQP